MNYQKHYLKLIEKASKRCLNKDVYCEKHHIVPKSIFHNEKAHKALNRKYIKEVDESKNKIKLLPEEHLIAHLLLVRIFKNYNTDCYQKMLYAANFLTSRVKSNKDYKKLKIEYAKMLSIVRTGKPSGSAGWKWSQKRIDFGCPHLKGKTYEQIHGTKKAKELKKSRSAERKGKTFEEVFGEEKAKELKKNLSNRVITDSWKNKISKANKGKKRTPEVIEKMKEYMRDDKKNPSVHQEKYEFLNIKTNEKIIARKIDMKKRYGCTDIHKLIRGERKTCRKWKLIKKVE